MHGANVVRAKNSSVGDALGLILPNDLFGRPKLDQGASLYSAVNIDGTLNLSSHDPAFVKGLEVAEKAMDTDRGALPERKTRGGCNAMGERFRSGWSGRPRRIRSN
ncbi:hypothetical protein [Methylorubrum sp. POS3]|uniref:hypothetical protein n=1 Tax=Methylorubrum sp. POS3 TaxID=2998492 RepID=UPI003729C8E5